MSTTGNKHRSIAIAAILWLCGSTFLSSAHAAGTITNAVSAREAGRGGANMAFGDNGAVLLDNPSGIGGLIGNCDSHDSYFDVGGVGLFTNLSYADAENPTTGAADNPTGLGHFMVGRRLSEDVVMGFGGFAVAGFASDYDLTAPAPFGDTQTYKSFGALMRILPGLSVDLTDRWSIGGTLGAAVSHVEIEGPYFLNSAPLAGTPTILDLQTTGTAMSWSLGTQYRLTPATTIGLRYQSENAFESSGRVGITIPGVGQTHYDAKVGLTWASSIGIGLQHRFNNNHRIGIDIEYENWADAFDDATLVLSNPTNPVYQAAFPNVTEVLPLRWKDAVVIGLGYEVDVSAKQTFRFGYRYQDNPIPANTTTTYMQTTLEHHFSVGHTTRHQGWEFDAAYQFAFAPEVQTGTSAVAGGDFSNATINTQAHMVFLSMMRRF